MILPPTPQRTVDDYYGELIKSLKGDDPELLLICIRKLKTAADSYRFEGDDLLSLAIAHNCRHCIAPLKNLGFDMNRLSPKSKKHPLEEAMDANSMVVLEVLLKLGALPNAPHTVYGTMMHAAAATRKVDSLIPCLVARGGDPNIMNADGTVPLQLAVKNTQVINVEQLLERGARINAVDSQGRSPLHLAVMLELFDPIAYVVLDYGADPMMPDVHGVTPIDLAKGRHEINLTRTLEDRANWVKQLNFPPPLGRRKPLEGEAFREELLAAIERGNRRVIYEMFTGRGGLPWAATYKQSDSPLLTALKYRRFDMAAIMMGFEYGIMDRDLDLRNAAHYVMSGTTNPKVLLPFLKRIYKVNPRFISEADKNGLNPLSAALASGTMHDSETAESVLNEASRFMG